MAIDFGETGKHLDFVLEKKKITHVKNVTFGFIGDVSGSMSSLWQNGVMQDFITRAFVVADRMDDNHSMDVICFDTQAYPLPDMVQDNYQSYVQKNVLENQKIDWGGTVYSKPLKHLVKLWYDLKPKGFLSRFIKKDATEEKQHPGFILFQSDGDCFDNDHHATEQAIIELAEHPVYIMFIGFNSGGVTFDFMRYLADKYDHVGFIKFDDISGMSSDEIYTELLTDEVATWFRSVSKK